MKKIFFFSLVATSFLTSCRQWYSLQNFLGIGHYEIVSNAENWLVTTGTTLSAKNGLDLIQQE